MAMLPNAFEALFNLQSALDAYRQSDWLERSTRVPAPFRRSTRSARVMIS